LVSLIGKNSAPDVFAPPPHAIWSQWKVRRSRC
jgi:hypothetical protein